MAAASATSRVLGVGIIGAGVIGQRLARAVAEVGTTLAVRAVCDVNVPAAEALAKSCGDDVTVTSDFKALIADSNGAARACMRMRGGVPAPPAWMRARCGVRRAAYAHIGACISTGQPPHCAW